MSRAAVSQQDPSVRSLPTRNEVRSMAATPTVLLVHGAFADSSGWNGVLSRLHEQGITARSVSNPLRGISHDAAYVASAIKQTDGPVVAVGHSYGGAVITN